MQKLSSCLRDRRQLSNSVCLSVIQYNHSPICHCVCLEYVLSVGLFVTFDIVVSLRLFLLLILLSISFLVSFFPLVVLYLLFLDFYLLFLCFCFFVCLFVCFF